MIERLKTLVLVLLIVSTLALGYWNLGLSYFDSVVSQPAFALNTYDYFDLMRPHSFHYAVGGISYTRIYEKSEQIRIWRQLAPVLQEALMKSKAIKPVDLTRFVADYRSGALLLGFADFVVASDLTNGQGTGVVPGDLAVSEVLLGAEQILLYDRASGQRYEVLTNAEPITAERIRTVVGETITRRVHRRLFDRYSLNQVLADGEEPRNYTLIPYQYDMVHPSYRSRMEIDPTSEAQVVSIAREIFGNLDFVKRLVDSNGSKVFMYGYGDRSLTFRLNGIIEYRSKFDGIRAKSTWSSSLQIACSFLEALGPLPESLELVSVIQHSAYEYEFVFSYSVAQYEALNIGGAPLEMRVRVQSNQVVEARREVVLATESLPNDSVRTMVTVDQCLTNHKDIIAATYLAETATDESVTEEFNADDYFFQIRAAIRSIDHVYVLSNTRWEPCWRIVIGKQEYLFHEHDGRMM